MPGKVFLFIGFLIGLFDGMVFVGCGYVQVFNEQAVGIRRESFFPLGIKLIISLMFSRRFSGVMSVR